MISPGNIEQKVEATYFEAQLKLSACDFNSSLSFHFFKLDVKVFPRHININIE